MSTLPSISQMSPKPGQISPRKQAIARHNDISRNSGSFRNFRNGLRKKLGDSTSSRVKSMERRVLFQCDNTRVLSFQNLERSKGDVLAHGRLEIYSIVQPHSETTYLQCGNDSLVHPILHKLKVLKVENDAYLLLLANPERYWKIVFARPQQSVLVLFEKVLKQVCEFRNLCLADSTETLKEESSSEKAATPRRTTPSSPVTTKVNGKTLSTSANTPNSVTMAQAPPPAGNKEQVSLLPPVYFETHDDDISSVGSSIDSLLFDNDEETNHDTTTDFKNIVSGIYRRSVTEGYRSPTTPAASGDMQWMSLSDEDLAPPASHATLPNANKRSSHAWRQSVSGHTHTVTRTAHFDFPVPQKGVDEWQTQKTTNPGRISRFFSGYW